MPVNAGGMAFVPLFWAFNSSLGRHTAALKALVFLSKVADGNGLLLMNGAVPYGHPDNRISQLAECGNLSHRNAKRGLAELFRIGACRAGFIELQHAGGPEVWIDRAQLDVDRFDMDRANFDRAGDVVKLQLTRPAFVWPQEPLQRASNAPGYTADIAGVLGRHSRGTRPTSSGYAADTLGVQNQPRLISPGSPAQALSTQGNQPRPPGAFAPVRDEEFITRWVAEQLMRAFRARHSNVRWIAYERLAASVGLERQRVQDILKGHATAEPAELNLLCKELGVKPVWREPFTTFAPIDEGLFPADYDAEVA